MESERPKHILIVDDEREITELIEKELQREGYMTWSADNAQDALTVFSTEVIDMIITDVKMPGEFSGIDLLKIIRNGFSIPVIVISGFGTIELALEAIRLGADEFIPKPFDYDYLISVVREKFSGGSIANTDSGDIPFVIRFDVTGSTSTIAPIRKLLMKNAESLGISADIAASIWMLAKDAVTRARISPGGGSSNIIVQVKNDYREVEIVIADRGNRFISSQISPGSGGNTTSIIDIIRSLADDIMISDDGDEMRVIFLK